MSDGPFPPHGLPPRESGIFRMVYDLAFHERFMLEMDAETEMTTSGPLSREETVFQRKVGSLTLEVEYAIRLPENLVRIWVRVVTEDETVFSAWSSRIPASDQGIGLVERFVPGPWAWFLRTRHEMEPR